MPIFHGSFRCRTALTVSSLIAFTDKEPKDFMVPSRWGTVCILTDVGLLKMHAEILLG